MAQTPEHTTRGTSTARALGIFEIAQDILLQLPIKDLIHASRVSKQFQSTIANSRPLQRALFLKPLNGGTVILVTPRPGRTVFLSDESSEISVHALRNPFAKQVMKGLNKGTKAFLRPEATWRRMLLSQPPMRLVYNHAERKFRDDKGVKLLQSVVAAEKGPKYKVNFIEAWAYLKVVELAVEVKRMERPLAVDDPSQSTKEGAVEMIDSWF